MYGIKIVRPGTRARFARLVTITRPGGRAVRVEGPELHPSRAAAERSASQWRAFYRQMELTARVSVHRLPKALA